MTPLRDPSPSGAESDRLQDQNRVLVRLAKSPAAAAGDLEGVLRELAVAAAETLAVERASLWLFDPTHTRIECVELYERTPARHSRGVALTAADFPAYFRALEEERAIVAHDAHADPHTREFSATYLTPLGITSMLDAPVRFQGQMVGVFCHEHVGPPRRWTLEEQSFATSIADLAALAIEASERLRTEDKLREQAQILDLAHDAILVRDLDGRILSWNRGAEEIYGWTGEQAVGRTTHELLHTRFPQPLPMIETQLLRSGRWDGELVHTHRDGRALDIDSRWALLRNARGQAAGILEIGRDVTESRAGEEARRESEERFRQLADNVGAVFLVIEGATAERAGRLLYVNRAYERIWGASVESLHADPRSWMQAVHPDDLPRVKAALPDVVQGRFDQEYRIVRPDGEVRWVHVRVYPIRDERGVPYRNAALVDDITERKRTEEELRRAMEAAEAANRAKDQFLATLSHELRTPLTPVLALASSLQDDPELPPRARDALATIRRNIDLEARLIDDLLDLTRISRGKLELHREVADVRGIVEHALRVCCGDELDTGRVHVDLGGGELRVWADAPRLTQVFWNLFKNAIKFTAEGEVRVRSRKEERADGGEELVVEVADTGIGIEPELLPRIFNAFEQADRRITRRFGGLGLGLALSKTIVELHGGSLTAASDGPGQGATFTVRLPLLAPREEALPESAPAVAALDDTASVRAATAQRARTEGLHLLLVEDHADTADAMAELLRMSGHRVTVARSMGLALAAAEKVAGEDEIDLVVSDLGLPDGSGLDLMRELSRRYGLRGVALSGYGMEEDVRRSHEAGFQSHLTKPVTLQALRDAIRDAILTGE
jgi:two-component system CheB/CheR fusion protein